MRGPFIGDLIDFRPTGHALLCLRGKFTVTDAAKVKDLSLSLAYCGGGRWNEYAGWRTRLRGDATRRCGR